MKTDFEHWLEYHSAAYPGFAKWILANDGQESHIERLLGHFKRERLEAATDALYAQDDQPHGYSNHARYIHRLVESHDGPNTAGRERGPELRDGQLTARCHRCMDYGMVEVLSPASLAGLRQGGGVGVLRTYMLVCDCSAGDGQRGTRWQDGHCLIRFEGVIGEAIRLANDYADLDEAAWHVAAMLVRERDEQLRPKAVALSGGMLP